MTTKLMIMLLMVLVGWMNWQQQEVIEYLKVENTKLKEELLNATGKKCILLNDSQRRRLAILGKRRGRKLMGEVCCAFSSDTLLGWHRNLVAMKYDGSKDALNYFDSVTNGWIDYSHNKILVQLFSHALVSSIDGHESAFEKIKENIVRFKQIAGMRN